MIGLNINIKKSEVMPLNTSEPPVIDLNGTPLDFTSSFTYLGSIVTSEGGADNDIRARIGRARTAFLKLRHIWKTSNISKNTKTKIRLYNSCVLVVLLYGAECLRMTEKDTKKLSSIHNGCLRMILMIFWQRKITNIDLHERTGSNNMETLLKQKRWKWIGHDLRRPAEDLTRVALRWTPERKRKDAPKQLGEEQLKPK